MTSKRKKSHRKGGVGFKNVPDDEKKPMSKEEEEKHKKFESMRKIHYKNEFQKPKNKPPTDDEDDEEGEMSSTTQNVSAGK